jgi:tRNA G18 (ribose-2'-O)-methylase SpoU
MPIETLADPDDPRVAWYGGVRDPVLLQRGGRFIVEGRAVVTRLLAERRWTVESVMVSPAAFAALRPALAERPEVPVFVVDPDRLVGVAGYNILRGCLAVGVRDAATSATAPVPPEPAPVVTLGLEGLADADNVGACFRHAAAFGVDAVLLDDACADPLYRKAIRTSMGAALRVPHARVPSWPETVAWLHGLGVLTLALTPRDAADDIMTMRAHLRTMPRVAVLVGNEGRGLSRETLDACARRVRVAMAPGMDSVNVATAAAIALHALWSARHRPPEP